MRLEQVWDSCRGSSGSIVTRLRAGRLGFDSWQDLGFLSPHCWFKQALRPTQPLIQWVLIIRSPG